MPNCLYVELLNFQKSGDQDGFIGDFSAKTELKTEIYQVKVKTLPGEGLFEASITHDVQKDVFDTKVCSHPITVVYPKGEKVSLSMQLI